MDIKEALEVVADARHVTKENLDEQGVYEMPTQLLKLSLGLDRILFELPQLDEVDFALCLPSLRDLQKALLGHPNIDALEQALERWVYLD